MNKEDILTWLTQLGTGWVGLNEVYEVYAEKDDGHLSFWDKLDMWHDSAHITKRYNSNNVGVMDHDVEQYRLNKRAIESLEA